MKKILIYLFVITGLIFNLNSCGGGGGGSSSTTNTSSTSATYSISVNATGLTGVGLVLQNNGSDDLTVSNNGDFVFDTEMIDGASYAVTIKSDPAGQNCGLNNNNGVVNGSNINDISITCYDASAASAQIQNWRDAQAGNGIMGGNGLIDGAIVTYIRPKIGNDNAGFFLQAEKNGPALFVNVDPSTLSPPPHVGDVVSITPNAKLGTYDGTTQVYLLNNYTVDGHNALVADLSQDVTKASDLVSAVDSYESELIQLNSATITGTYAAAGTGFVSAQVETSGISGDPLLVLRVPETLKSTLGLDTGCVFTINNTPLWRDSSIVQVSAWVSSDASVISCPSPSLIQAYSTGPQSVTLSFNREINPASITSAISQFVIDNGLNVSSASVSGTHIELATDTQAPYTNYTVTVANTVTDYSGVGMDSNNNSASFVGYSPISSGDLIINEVNYDNPNTDTNEYVEIYNTTANPVVLAGIKLFLVNGADNSTYGVVDLSPAGTLPAHSYLVVGSTTLITTLPQGTQSIAFSLAENNIQNGAPDGLAIIDTYTATVLDALSYEGEITAATIDTGFTTEVVNLVEGTATTAFDDGSTTGSLSRCPNGTDTNDAMNDWTFRSTLTPGAANNCP